MKGNEKMSETENIYKHDDRLIPLTEWPDYHPWPSVSGLRHLVFHADKNGFAEVVVRVGGRVLLNERRFFEWAHNNNSPVYDR